MVATPSQIRFAAFDNELFRQLRARAALQSPFDDLLARQAERVTRDADVTATSAALGELLVRWTRVERERASLAIERRPAAPHGTGAYTVGGHDVWLGSIDPVDAACECRDFRCASLGVCIHVLVVLDEVWAARRLPQYTPPIALRWDPIRPFSGAGDWLERVWCDRAAIGSELGALFRGGARASLEVPADPAERAVTIEVLQVAIARGCPADPGLRAQLAREGELARPAIATVDADAQLARMTLPLFDYQREGVRLFLAAGRLVLGDDMGLGKTAQAIAACHVLFALGHARRALVVVPAPLKWQWAREWGRFSSLEPVVVDGVPRRRHAMYRRDEGVLIVNYEQVRVDREDLVRFAPDVVILDEAQRIKNAATQTARWIKRLAPPWRLALTGTPMENRLEELSSIVEWVDDMALEPRWRLGGWHAMRDEHGQMFGARDLTTIRTRIGARFVRRVRSDVLRQLPPRRDTEIPIAITDRQSVAHDRVAQKIAMILGRIREGRATREDRLRLTGLLTEQRLICSGLALARFEEWWPQLPARPTEAFLDTLDSPKLHAIRELLAAVVVEQGRRVIVFSQWRRMLQLVAWATNQLLAAADVRGTWFTGRERMPQRIANVAALHDDPAVRVLWASDAGSVGLDLQRAASCCINLELPWNPAVLEQRIGRVYRLGQTEPVDVYNLITVDGIERRIAGVVEAKRMLFDGLFDRDVDEIDFERGDAHDRIAYLTGARP